MAEQNQQVATQTKKDFKRVVDLPDNYAFFQFQTTLALLEKFKLKLKMKPGPANPPKDVTKTLQNQAQATMKGGAQDPNAGGPKAGMGFPGLQPELLNYDNQTLIHFTGIGPWANGLDLEVELEGSSGYTLIEEEKSSETLNP